MWEGRGPTCWVGPRLTFAQDSKEAKAKKVVQWIKGYGGCHIFAQNWTFLAAKVKESESRVLYCGGKEAAKAEVVSCPSLVGNQRWPWKCHCVNLSISSFSQMFGSNVFVIMPLLLFIIVSLSMLNCYDIFLCLCFCLVCVLPSTLLFYLSFFASTYIYVCQPFCSTGVCLFPAQFPSCSTKVTPPTICALSNKYNIKEISMCCQTNIISKKHQFHPTNWPHPPTIHVKHVKQILCKSTEET